MSKFKTLFIQNGLWLVLVVMAIVYRQGLVWQSLPLPPGALHISAQCDRASIAQNYYVDGVSFFEPHINNLLRETGIAATEFPLIPYVSSVCYKIFGYHDFWYRFLVFLVFSIGFVFSFFIAKLFLKNIAAALLVCTVWLCSPTLLYYIPNFNPDPASLGLILIAWFLFFRLQKHFSLYTLLFFSLASALAVLLKASSAISVIAMVALLALDQLKWLSADKTRIVHKKPAVLLGIVCAMLLSYAWYHYASQLNEFYFSGFFTLYPRIPETKEQVQLILQELRDNFLFHYYPPATLILLATAQVLLLSLNKYINRQLLWISWILAAGTLAFFILMFAAMGHHDYYIITLLPWPFFVFLSLAQGLQNWLHEKPQFITALVFAGAFFMMTNGIAHSHKMNTLIYDKSNFVYNEPLFEAYYTVAPLLREAGVQRNERMVTMTDCTYDVSLYLMNQKGFTVSDKKDMPHLLHFLFSRGGKYLMTNSAKCLPHSDKIIRFMGNPILKHQNLTLYKPNLHSELADSLRQIMFKHLSPFYNELKPDVKFNRYNRTYVNRTGVSMQAVYEESSIYLYMLKEKELAPGVEQFIKEQTGKEATITQEELLNQYIQQNHLSTTDAEVILHPMHTWFN